MTDDRRRREGWGRKAESLAAFALRLKGYRVLAGRLRTPAGEIDLIVRRGATIAFVEVKARATRGRPPARFRLPSGAASSARRRIILPQIPASAPSLTGLMRF
jgi:hypothetical protein